MISIIFCVPVVYMDPIDCMDDLIAHKLFSSH